jgi:pyruvate kinase
MAKTVENRPVPHTRIVATIGPASARADVLERMIRAGMNVARLNFSHGDFATHAATITLIRAASAAVGRRVAIMADLPGPKMRIGELAGDRVVLAPGAPLVLTTEPIAGTAGRVSVSFEPLPRVVKPGDAIYLNDGYVQLEVRSIAGRDVTTVVTVGGELRSRKGLNLPGIDLGISAFTERDRDCLECALANGVDAVSQSFVEGPDDIAAVRAAARALGHDPFVLAKIERIRALDRLHDILAASDGLMIARGDLGVEVPIERIAVIQKEVTRLANQHAKPVITATQMLESMTTHRLPTRAEATDVANAILDGTDAVMLSGESATGDYPVEAVEMLAKIAAAVEPTRRRLPVADLFAGVDLAGRLLSEHLVALGVEACFTYDTPAAIVVPTTSGASARRIAMLRLPVWTVAASADERVCQRLQFSYGVVPLHVPRDPASWSDFARDWVRGQGLGGRRVLLAGGPSPANPAANHRLEIVDL